MLKCQIKKTAELLTAEKVEPFLLYILGVLRLSTVKLIRNFLDVF